MQRGRLSIPTSIGPAEADAAVQPYYDLPWKLRFWSIFTGQAVSLVGSALTQFVLLWWITDTTGSVAALATAGIAALLPQALLGPLGGVMADRYSRRALMIGADGISALCMLVVIALFLTNSIELWQAYAMMAVRSAMQAFQSPAAASSTAMLVPSDFLPRAAGLNQTLIGLMTVAAAPLGAVAISVMPIGLALGIDVLTAVMGIAPLLIFRIPQPSIMAAERSGIWGEFCSGVRLIWNHPQLRRLYIMLSAVVLVIMPAYSLIPLLVKQHFAGGVEQVAIMEGVAGGAMILGGLVVAMVAPARPIRWILWGFATSSFALALTALMPSHFFWLAVIFWGVSGAAFVAGDAPFMALLQSIVPNHQQGRALSLLMTVLGLAGPVGLAIAIPMGELIGIRWLLVLEGLFAGGFAMLGFWSRSLREFSGHVSKPSQAA